MSTYPFKRRNHRKPNVIVGSGGINPPVFHVPILPPYRERYSNVPFEDPSGVLTSTPGKHGMGFNPSVLANYLRYSTSSYTEHVALTLPYTSIVFFDTMGSTPASWAALYFQGISSNFIAAHYQGGAYRYMSSNGGGYGVAGPTYVANERFVLYAIRYLASTAEMVVIDSTGMRSVTTASTNYNINIISDQGSSGAFQIGQDRAYGGRNWPSKIYDVRIYDRSVSDAQLAALYLNPWAIYGEPGSNYFAPEAAASSGFSHWVGYPATRITI